MEVDFDFFIKTTDGVFLSSLLCRDGFISVVEYFVAHGPCASFEFPGPLNIDTDVLLCLSFTSWPKLANEWKERTRINNWPPSDLISEIVHEGCLVVPIGNPNSQDYYVQWRISFSLAEKKLVHSFNHTQFLCYGFLKLYLKHVIDLKVEVKGLLCSYFLKTCLLYCIEDEPINWTRYNFLDCFWICLRRLIKWVRDEYCPNYFIKQNNMFEGKVSGEKGRILLNYLTDLYHDGITRFRLIPGLSELHIFNTHNTLSTNIPVNSFLDRIEKEYLRDESMLKIPIHFSLNFINPNPFVCVSYMVSIATLMSQSKNKVERSLMRFNLCVNASILVQYMYQYIVSTASNKTGYEQIKALKTFIIQNIMDTDICTGMILLATLSYLNGKYEETVSLVMRLLRKLKTCFLYNCWFQTRLYHKKEYIRAMGGKGFTVHQKRNRGLWARSFFCISNCRFFPQELHEIIPDIYIAFIPLLVYSYVLLFLHLYI